MKEVFVITSCDRQCLALTSTLDARTQCFSNVEPENLIEPVEYGKAADEWEGKQAPEWASSNAPENIPRYDDPLIKGNDEAKSARQCQAIKNATYWAKSEAAIEGE